MASFSSSVKLLKAFQQFSCQTCTIFGNKFKGGGFDFFDAHDENCTP